MFTAVLFLGGLGAAAALVLVVVSRLYSVPVDPRIEKVTDALSGINCGACGYSSCAAAAEAVINGKADNQVCLVGGADASAAVAAIMGTTVSGTVKTKRAYLMCGRNMAEAGTVFDYSGPEDCRSAALLYGGGKVCSGGCVGFGTCATICPVDAITMRGGIPVISTRLCTGCGLCVSICPKKILTLIEDTPAAISKKQCAEYCMMDDLHFEVDREHCIKCGICFKNCPSGAIVWQKGETAIINKDKCTHCLTCLRLCPPKVIF